MIYHAEKACLSSGIAENVLLEVKGDVWGEITANTPAPEQAIKLQVLLIPALINTHSHAFQRSFAGLTEVRDNPHDDFWSWRVKMYQAALTMTPESLYEIAFKLYSELKAGGYAHVCEFHYLHHAPDGTPYKNPFIMGETLVEAANKAGLDITMLPVLYERAGFTKPTLQDDQRRFKTNAQWVYEAYKHFKGGIAIHSLRAASEREIRKLLALMQDDAPIHIHVSEQTREVEECISVTGKRPIEWLMPMLDNRWHLVHSTHTTPHELEGIAKAKANVVLCPATEANLGDGLCDLEGLLAHNIPLSIGSDSHISRDFRDELRLLEYGQRLLKRQRNVGAGAFKSTGENLFAAMVNGQAAGFKTWGLVEGAKAKAMVLDESLDEAIFSYPPKKMRWFI
jgi:formimidoylglutamate deiminase